MDDERNDETIEAGPADTPDTPETPDPEGPGGDEPATDEATPSEAAVDEASRPAVAGRLLPAEAGAVDPAADAETATPGEEYGEGEDESVLPAPEVRAVVEALVFAAPQPLTPREMGRVLGGVAKEDWERALEELREDYARDDRGLQLIEVAGGWQITTRPEYNDWVRELLDPKTPTRLSIQALETLSVIAYRQPVTLPEIIELRGVRSQGVVKTLLEKRLIRITGRKEVVGRPMLYGTTKQFLLHFGLKDLEELPQIEEFAEVLGEEVDIPGLKRAIDAPRPTEIPLSEGDQVEQGSLFDETGHGEADGEGEAAAEETATAEVEFAVPDEPQSDDDAPAGYDDEPADGDEDQDEGDDEDDELDEDDPTRE